MTVSVLKVARMSRGIHQSVLAKELGIGQSYISKLELLECSPGDRVARRLESYFDRPATELLKPIEI